MIFVEGKPDKIPLKSIGIANRNIRIEGSKGKVCNRLIKNKNVKGMVDEDPLVPQPSYLKRLRKRSEDKNLIEYIDDQNSNRLAMIKPYLEEWVMYTCNTYKIDLSAYFLPNTSKELKRVINGNLDKFNKLISENREIEALKKLKEFINT
ncbi:hypothetical protein C900_02823 [Fulvivirga imtechensis AK7]|uniref:DUF4435 domain-containing protein n=1 Tax=Fulvivirga imtechensis AK7 TaxID=1237149 RepID=L8JR76_9BACT|nr:hypothetical protein [Fulvivirga imtechensis]ELR71365.1 hypothetical protein C900_02823 [Fulvivirga imtechensis AK7]